MSQSELATAAAQVILNATHWLIEAVRKHWWTAMTGAVLFGMTFLIGSSILTWYGSFFAKEIVLLVGPAGSTSWRQGDDFADAIKKASPAFGLKYRVRQELTNGYDEIQHRIANDTTGTIVGFGFEAINPELNIPQILIPLDWEYLHVLCSRQFIIDTYSMSSRQQPLRLTDVLPEIKPGRIYLGPHESGTRRIAETILSRCGRLADEYSVPGITDWEEAEVAIATGKIDLVFYSGPLGSKTIRIFAKSSVLLNLDDMAPALSNEAGSSIWVAQLEQNTSFVNIHRSHHDAKTLLRHASLSTKEDDDPRDALKFCPEAIKTVSSRGLLICSPAMSAYDAFQIAKSVQENCRSIPSNLWNSRPIQKSTDQYPVSEISLPIHPGAKRLKQNQPYYDSIDPRGWPQWFQAALLTLLTALVGILLGKIKEKLVLSTPPVDVAAIQEDVNALRQEIAGLPADHTQQTSEALAEKLTRLELELKKSESQMAAQNFDELTGQLQKLRALLHENSSATFPTEFQKTPSELNPNDSSEPGAPHKRRKRKAAE